MTNIWSLIVLNFFSLCHDLAKWLSQYLYFLFFSFIFWLLFFFSFSFHLFSYQWTHKRKVMSASKVRWPELSQLSLCSEFDKENSMEFSLISLPTYTFYYCGYALILPWSSCYSSHVTPCDCDLWPSVTPIVTLWQSHVILSHAPPCSCKSKEKEKKRKEI